MLGDQKAAYDTSPYPERNLFQRLLDGSHVNPNERRGIIQDDHPNRASCYTQALKRYEDSLIAMGNERSVQLDDHYGKISQHVKDLESVKKAKLDK